MYISENWQNTNKEGNKELRNIDNSFSVILLQSIDNTIDNDYLAISNFTKTVPPSKSNLIPHQKRQTIVIIIHDRGFSHYFIPFHIIEI